MSQDFKKIVITICAIMILFVSVFTTYASLSELSSKGVKTKILRIDEDSYGNFVFDSSNLEFSPILDNDVNKQNNNVIYIDFRVGGSKENNTDNIFYNIALANLEVDCELLSPYLKWKLLKNGEFISEGSLDYKFDTIKNGRLVLTPIQQDLVKYSEDKNTYDYYEFYMWISDSYQGDSLIDYSNEFDQSNLISKKIKGRIEVELSGGNKKTLIRNPKEELDTSTCLINNQ